jgi:beta-lactamase class A
MFAVSGGRLGVAMLDTARCAKASHRADERFAMCSTFTLPAAAAVLGRGDHGIDRLDRRIAFGKADLLPSLLATRCRRARANI